MSLKATSKDPLVAAIIQGIYLLSCSRTLNDLANIVEQFKKLTKQKGYSAKDVVIMLINVDDSHSEPLAEMLMPNHDWLTYHDTKGFSFKCGLSKRQEIEVVLRRFDSYAA